MNKHISAAVVGVGAMGQHHARVYRDGLWANLLAVVDADLDRAVEIGTKYGCKAYDSLEAMLESVRPEAVSVCVPTSMHLDVALKCLEAGCHVLVEKPIASSEEEAQEIIDAAERLDKVLAVGHIERYNPAIRELKYWLGQAGDIYKIDCHRAGPFPPRVRDVGVVIDLAVHDIDIIHYLTDSRVARIYAETKRRIHTEHEDMLSAVMRLDNGVVCSLNTNWLQPGKMRQVTVVGSRGLFVADLVSQDLFFYQNVSTTGVESGNYTRTQVEKYEPLAAELEDFASACCGQDSTIVTGEAGLDALTVARGLVESGRINAALLQQG